jgi:hypothetical protein
MFSFGQSEKERVAVSVLRPERPDNEWLIVQVEVTAGGFRGSTSAHIRTSELAGFAAQLQPLYQTLSGTARFETLEGQLELHLTGDGKGHINLEGLVRDQCGRGNHLNFHLEFDQSQLAQSIKELDAALSAYGARAI